MMCVLVRDHIRNSALTGGTHYNPDSPVPLPHFCYPIPVPPHHSILIPNLLSSTPHSCSSLCLILLMIILFHLLILVTLFLHLLIIFILLLQFLLLILVRSILFLLFLIILIPLLQFLFFILIILFLFIFIILIYFYFCSSSSFWSSCSSRTLSPSSSCHPYPGHLIPAHW